MGSAIENTQDRAPRARCCLFKFDRAESLLSLATSGHALTIRMREDREGNLLDGSGVFPLNESNQF